MSRTIISIDDSDIAQAVIQTTLSEFGFDNVVSFLDPAEALEAISSGTVAADLILLDIMMPGIDGIELCARIRGLAQWTDIPIIMLTSRKDTNSLSQAFLAGANDYVTKPFDRIELQARIRSSLRLKAALDRRRTEPRQPAGNGKAARGGGAAFPSSEPIPGLVAQRFSLHAALSDLGESDLKDLGIVALCIDRLQGDHDFNKADKLDIIRATGAALGQVSISAGNLFGHWEDDIFCLISLRSDQAALVDLATRCMSGVAESAVELPLPWGDKTVTISAGIVPPGAAKTVAGGMADAINAAVRASRGSPGSIEVKVSPTVSQGPNVSA
ncbi:response regulator [Puniceibacterium sp. IMCC21224]|uniref:response regulator n=1 Tax=Puniceibacterium sp. IMCC21224 TaxID=1618204 RepID=UPI00064DE380|nr:response regulator [Puniceibacterium sp. IMCC21224]KMK64953.1 response regulator receiver modulated diguanylate cyclase [Puniceibacterium sp. IMCC21224]